MIKKLLLAKALFLGCFLSLNSQSIVINEIMYNSPESGADSLEFIEFYNTTSSSIDMTGYTTTSGVVFTFPSFILAANSYALIVGDSMAFVNEGLGSVVDFEWTSGGLSNGGEPITLKDGSGGLIDSLRYDDNAPWDNHCDGNGSSLILCDPTTDNTLGANWGRSYNWLHNNANSDSVWASPGMVNTCGAPAPPTVYVARTIDEINNSNLTTGVADSLGLTVEVRGVVQCVNYRTSGYDMPLANLDNEGIRLFSFTDVNSYTAQAGDSVRVKGEVAQYNGLIQLIPDSIIVISSANATVTTPMVVTALSEATDNKFVEILGVHIVDPAAWTNTGAGFTVEVTDGGSDTTEVRIDADVNIYGSPVPTGTFDISGWGGQYDSSNPYTEGYQLLPCTLNNITANTTSISSIESVNKLVVYPNPSNTGMVNFSEVISGVMLDISGKQVLAFNKKKNVSVASLKEGVYFINTNLGTYRFIKK